MEDPELGAFHKSYGINDYFEGAKVRSKKGYVNKNLIYFVKALQAVISIA